MVHRDLKPANVLLAEDGPRLIHFGISRSLEAVALTRTGIVVGSPGFMSPEQADGREAGPPSDIFSLGAVLVFAATGQGPFGDGTTPALLYRVVCTQPNTSGLPGQIRPVIERCLAKDPRSRPTAAQLLAELSTALPPALPRARPRTRAWPLGPVRRRPPSGPADAPGHGACHTLPGQPGRLGADGFRAAAGPPRRADAAPVTGPPMPSTGPQLPRITASPLPPGYDRPVAPPPRRRRPFRPGQLVAIAAAVVLAAGAGAFLAAKAEHRATMRGPPRRAPRP